MIYELEMPWANTASAYLVSDKEAEQYEMTLAGQSLTCYFLFHHFI